LLAYNPTRSYPACPVIYRKNFFGILYRLVSIPYTTSLIDLDIVLALIFMFLVNGVLLKKSSALEPNKSVIYYPIFLKKGFNISLPPIY